MAETEKLKIRPYARLLTMLGEQLIKDERIALVELIKNAYDADADWVKISFEGFGDNYEVLKGSKIIIEDNGHGMNEEIIKEHWLNPGTPEKKERKRNKEKTKGKGREMQGEKGIGRFAILKLGNKIDIITRAVGEENEYIIEYDFSMYEEDFFDNKKYLFLDDINISLTSRDPERILDSEINLGSITKSSRSEHGMIIEISQLKGNWSTDKVERIYDDLVKLSPIFPYNEEKDFMCYVYKNSEFEKFDEAYLENLERLCSENSVIRIEEGRFDSKNLEYEFKINDMQKSIPISDTRISGSSFLRKRFKNIEDIQNNEDVKERCKDIGSFNFSFHIFDFNSDKLSLEEKKLIKEHRIYLYRDDIRVYPYGNPEDDWLGIDIHRGIVRSGDFLSNDQVVGVINITRKNNENLKDKTNREGLIHEGNTTDDFIAIIQAFLSYIRKGPYTHYLEDIKNKEKHDTHDKKIVDEDFFELRKILEDIRDTFQTAIEKIKCAIKKLNDLEKKYKSEKKHLVERAEMVEDLAGVGLSVEIASHDIMAIINANARNMEAIIQGLESGKNISQSELLKEISAVSRENDFVRGQLINIQTIFTSAKGRRKSINVEMMIERVRKIYEGFLKDENIKFELEIVVGSFTVKATEAALLQCFLNLLDNAVYWLKQIPKEDRVIKVLLNTDKKIVIFSDSGPGVNIEDAPYIFKPFYSAKGEDGRGFGLYITQQLLERHGYSIKLAKEEHEGILSGANFILNFSDGEKND